MARMIPADLPPDFDNRGELKVFAMLADDPMTEDWTVIHSLKLPKRKDKTSGEVDFVVIVPGGGVACLEVKSHGTIEVVDGRWFFGNKKKPDENPFVQVEGCSYDLFAELKRKRSDIPPGIFTSMVIFPFAKRSLFGRDEAHQEWHDWQLVSSDSLLARSLTHWITLAFDEKADLLAKAGKTDITRPNAAQCDELIRFLRPDMQFAGEETKMPAVLSIEGNDVVMTSEQFAAAELLISAGQAMISGPASTGKTSLAIEYARYAAGKGATVLFVCPDEWNVGRVSGELSGMERVRVVALDHIGENRDGFDELIIDAAEAAMTERRLSIMNGLLKDGLSKGRLKLFVDEAGIGPAPADDRLLTVAEMIVSWSPFIRYFKLRVNCRNEVDVAEAARLIRPLEDSYTESLARDSDKPSLFLTSSVSAADAVALALKDFPAGDPPEGLAIIAVDDESWIATDCMSALECEGKSFDTGIVAVAGALDEEKRRRLYLAITRFRNEVVLATDEVAGAELFELLEPILPA